jgi:hypothetical protein
MALNESSDDSESTDPQDQLLYKQIYQDSKRVLDSKRHKSKEANDFDS